MITRTLAALACAGLLHAPGLSAQVKRLEVPIVNFMWSAGIGWSHEPTRGVTMTVEARDHISRFEAPVQEGNSTRLHAVSLLVGLDLALWHTGGNAQRHPNESKR